MRIAVDAYRLVGRQAGVGRYLSSIVSAWRATRVSDHIDLICPGYNNDLEPYLWDHARALETGRNQRTIVWANLVLPRFASGADVLFCPSYFVPIKCDVPIVVAIHDVIHEVYPKSVPLYWLWRLRLGIRLAARKSEAVLTISNSSKEDICKYYGIGPSKVTVTYLAPSSIFRQIDRKHAKIAVLSHFGIERPYILYVGSILPRRNIGRLIQAFSSATKRLANYELVLAGKNFQKVKIDSMVGHLVSEGRIKHVSNPTDEQLLLLYSAADALVYPSSYEGFGLPVVEAMACGTPVITGNNSSLREIASGASLLVDVNSADSIKEALLLLANDEACRNDLRQKGLRRAMSFSWNRTSAETLAVLQRAARSANDRCK